MARLCLQKRALWAMGLLLCPLMLAACSTAAPNPPEPTETAGKPPAPVAKPREAGDYQALYPKLWSISEEGPAIPALDTEVVPQGIAYWAEKDWLIISNYMETGAPSILTIVDPTTQEFVKSVSLYLEDGRAYTGHAGGVAVSARHLWISSSEQVYWAPLEALAKVPDKGQLTFAGRFATNTRASFTTFADGILWVGEFYSFPDYPTDPDHRLMSNERTQYSAWVEGFVLDRATDLLPEARAVPAGAVTPDYILSVPDKIQGMAVTPHHIILSQSFGRTKDSALLKYAKPDLDGEPHQMVTVNGQSVPVWFLDRKNLSKNLGQLPLPPMSEGVITDGGNRLFVLFESGAKKYRATALSPMDRLRIIRLDDWDRQAEAP